MKKNKVILLASLFGVFISIVSKYSVLLNICEKKDYLCRDNFDNIEHATYVFFSIFIFSFITYFAPERVFVAWWKFARIAIPLILIPVLLINLEVHHSQNGDWQDIFDVQMLVLLYSIFTIGSTWVIWKGFKQK